MALQLNLLHEEIKEQRQRQRDPLKIGMMVLGAIASLFVLYYLVQAYHVLKVKGELASAQAEWSKVEPKVTSAQKRSAELSATINTTSKLEEKIQARVYWGPILERIARCVPPNAQIVGLDGTVDDQDVVSLTIEGLSAGAEPRAVAEDLRQMLLEQLTKNYKEVSVEFKTLEDIDTLVSLGGTQMRTARYFLKIAFVGGLPPTTDASPAPNRKSRHEKTESE